MPVRNSNNPYATPHSDSKSESSNLPFLWNWWQSILVCTLAGIIAAYLVAGLQLLLLPRLFLDASLALPVGGVLIALAFCIPFRWPKRDFRALMLLCIVSFFLLLIVDIVMAEMLVVLQIHVWLIAFMSLRSIVLIRCICWSLKINSSAKAIWLSLGPGAIAWALVMPIANSLPEQLLNLMFHFELDWSIIAAIQLRFVLARAKPITNSSQPVAG